MNAKRQILIAGWLTTQLLSILFGYKYAESYSGSQVPVVQSGLSLELQKEYNPARIVVLSGDLYDVFLQNGRRYLMRLNGSSGCPDESKEKVIQYFNEARRNGFAIKIKVLGWNENQNCWNIDLYSNDQNIMDWLVSNNYIYCK